METDKKWGNEPPNGMYPARVDDKGRLKLPVGFQEYISGLPEKKLFVTSLDRRIEWHLAHARACGCREIPESVKRAMHERGLVPPDQ